MVLELEHLGLVWLAWKLEIEGADGKAGNFKISSCLVAGAGAPWLSWKLETEGVDGKECSSRYLLDL